ncbi:MAG: polymer-forming cytoskeletal protein [Candidatus Eisenbacteria bacterium]|uniref:Polymer-forming cytoskeletal protein n=1 Tax=Eiseniibacteriota bacterium TaxID=2212470 RepID=A0A933W9E5_UNCEI|nr:polymer-forming cytoskeletal protein [Candidatus Eisenbacteria bacterium]
MWAFSASEFRRRAAAALCALVCAATLTAPASARVTIRTVSNGDSSGVVSRVTVDASGVQVTTDTSDPHSTRITTDPDSFGAGALIIEDGTGVVRFLSNAEVKAGDRVDGDVVAIGGNCRIAGSVTGSVVAVLGSVSIERGAHVEGEAVSVLGSFRSAGEVAGNAVAVLGSSKLEEGAKVGGDAVSVGGAVSEADSTQIGGQSVSLEFLPLTLGMPMLPTVIAFIFTGWLLSVLFGWVFATLFPDRLARIAVTSSRRTVLSVVVAVLAWFGWPILSLLLIFTLIGAPIGIMMWFVGPVASYAGQLAGTYVLGCKLLRRRLGEGPALGPIIAGTTFIALFFLGGALLWMKPGLPTAIAIFLFLTGILLQLALSTIGSGAILLSRLGALPKDLGGDSGPAAEPAAPADAATAPAS